MSTIAPPRQHALGDYKKPRTPGERRWGLPAEHSDGVAGYLPTGIRVPIPSPAVARLDAALQSRDKNLILAARSACRMWAGHMADRIGDRFEADSGRELGSGLKIYPAPFAKVGERDGSHPDVFVVWMERDDYRAHQGDFEGRYGARKAKRGEPGKSEDEPARPQTDFHALLIGRK